MYLVYVAICLFIIVFGLFFYFSFKAEKKNKEKNPLFIALFVSIIFGLLITSVGIFFILVFSGSLYIINDLFKLTLNQKQIIFLVSGYILFGLLFEESIVKITLHFIGKTKIAYSLVVGLIRLAILLTIGSLLSISEKTNIIIAFSMTIFLYLFDIATNYFKNSRE